MYDARLAFVGAGGAGGSFGEPTGIGGGGARPGGALSGRENSIDDLIGFSDNSSSDSDPTLGEVTAAGGGGGGGRAVRLGQ